MGAAAVGVADGQREAAGDLLLTAHREGELFALLAQDGARIDATGALVQEVAGGRAEELLDPQEGMSASWPTGAIP